MAFKMLAGRLYNAGVLVAKLEEVFKTDRKTIRSWGEAVVARDPERLARVLLGRGVNQKRTPAIDKYVAWRWAELRGEGCPNYRATLIREIESIFEVKLSGETLRQITCEIKESCAAMSGAPPALTVLPPFRALEEMACPRNRITTTDDLAATPYIHPSHGHPIYFECTDNFADLRGRFFPLIERLLASLQWSPQRILPLIVDLGIYSNDIFNQVLADPNIHFITWESGYQAEKDTPWEILSTKHRAAGTHGAHTFNR